MSLYFPVKSAMAGVLTFFLLTAYASDSTRFMFPMYPGEQNFLTGNMGELRHNHFHAGIDIKTRYQVGLPVYAAAAGYVEHISISPYGYGNMIRIKHADGYSTVYAHMLQFSEKINKILLAEQYRLQKNAIDIDLPPDALTLTRGEQIGLSGNSGGSGGPHLHFEIRRHDNIILDPLHFDFKEIVDKTPPLIKRLALVNKSITGRLQGDFGRYEPTVIAVSPGHYQIAAPVNVWGEFGLELVAIDKMDGVGNSFGIACLEVTLDGEEIYTHHLQSYDNRLKNSLNTHINYEEYKGNNGLFQRCYIADGNRLSIHTGKNRGIISIRDDKEHSVTISVWDTYQNVSRLTFKLKGNPSMQPTQCSGIKTTLLPDYKLYENVVKFSGNAGDNSCILYRRQGVDTLDANYLCNNIPVFLYDLRNGIPDSAVFSLKKIVFPYKAVVYPGIDFTYREPGLEVFFPAGALYDTLYLEIVNDINGLKIANPQIPLAQPLRVKYTAPEPLPQPWNKALAFVYTSGTNKKMIGGQAENNTTVTFSTKELGRLVFQADTTVPLIRLKRKSAGGVELKVFDNMSGIDNWTATVNGKWVMMSYDYKNGKMQTESYDKTIPLKGSFKVSVTDGAGNEATYTTWIP